jgi:ligand-binding sensor domain-containing protein
MGSGQSERASNPPRGGALGRSASRAFIGLALVAAAAGWPFAAHAQRYRVRTYTELDGLPSSSARDIAQDPQGRIWLLTRPGLTVYDGTTWETIHFPPRAHLPDYARFRLDAEGRAYTASLFGGLKVSSFDGHRWNVESEPSVNSADVGLLTDLALVPRPGGVIAAVATSRGGLFLLDRGAWKRAGARSGLPSDVVLALEAAEGRLAVGTDRGLTLLDPANLETREVVLPGVEGRA